MDLLRGVSEVGKIPSSTLDDPPRNKSNNGQKYISKLRFQYDTHHRAVVIFVNGLVLLKKMEKMRYFFPHPFSPHWSIF